jgi:N-acetylmuramoyl-L-alanine amidase
VEEEMPKKAEQLKMEEPEPADDLLKEDSAATAVSQAAPSITPLMATAPASKPVEKTPAKSQESSSAPVFKLQILTSSAKLKPNDPQLKGQKQADYYKEGGLYKYTLGSSENYQEIYQLRKAQVARFPQSFIIAFKDGKRMDVQEAIREWKSKKVKR